MSHDLANQALWIAFQHSGIPDLLAVPSIARDVERHWVLAQRPGQLVHQAAKHGPNDLTNRLWNRLANHRSLLKESIRHGNLAMIEYLYQHTKLPMNTQMGCRWSTRDTLQEAVHHGHRDVVRFFLNHNWTSSELQFALENALKSPDIAIAIVDHCKSTSKTIQVGNALYTVLIQKNHALFEALLNQGPKPRDDIMRTLGQLGDRRALEIFLRKQPRNSFACYMAILQSASTHGHARMVNALLKKCKAEQPKKSLDQQVDGISHGRKQRPRVSSAYRNGFLRLAKVLLRHGFPDSPGIFGAAEGYHEVVAHCLRRPTTCNDLLFAMKACARGECLEYQIKGIPTTSLWHYSSNINQNITFELLLQRQLEVKKPFDLFEMAHIAMTENNHVVAKIVLPHVLDLRRDHYVLGALAQSMSDPSIWQLLKEMSGDMTADEQEYHMMRNDREDGSIATSAIEVHYASDSD